MKNTRNTQLCLGNPPSRCAERFDCFAGIQAAHWHAAVAIIVLPFHAQERVILNSKRIILNASFMAVFAKKQPARFFVVQGLEIATHWLPMRTTIQCW